MEEEEVVAAAVLGVLLLECIRLCRASSMY